MFADGISYIPHSSSVFSDRPILPQQKSEILIYIYISIIDTTSRKILLINVHPGISFSTYHSHTSSHTYWCRSANITTFLQTCSVQRVPKKRKKIHSS